MRIFGNLLTFELKKLLCRKGAAVTLLISLALVIFAPVGTILGDEYIDGNVFESNYEAMKKDRDYARSISGRAIDTELLTEASKAYAAVPDTEESYMASEEYQNGARKYSKIYRFFQRIYEGGMPGFQNMTTEQAENLYAVRNGYIEQWIDECSLSDSVKNDVIKADSSLETPFVFSYHEGYSRFFTITMTTGLVTAVVIAILLAPIFAGEYTSGAVQTVLCAKHGKGKVIGAKLLAGFITAAAAALAFTLISYAECMAVFGTDGGDSPLQLSCIFFPYELTMKQGVLLYTAVIFCTCLMTASLTMLLSAVLRTPFPVIIIMFIALIAPMFFSVPENMTTLYNIFTLLPINTLDFYYISDYVPLDVFGNAVPKFAAAPVIMLTLGAVLMPFAYQGFRKHKI